VRRARASLFGDGEKETANNVRKRTRDEGLTEGEYRGLLKVWVHEDGRIKRVDVMKSNADNQTTEKIKSLIASMSIGEPLPEGIPQPLKLQINATKSG